MTRLIAVHPHQATLIMSFTHNALGSAVLRDRNDEVFGRRFLKSQLTIPGHILNLQERSVRHEQIIPISVANQNTIRRFDDLRKHGLNRIRRAIVQPFRAFCIFVLPNEDARETTFPPPSIQWRMKSLFDVCTIEVRLECVRWRVQKAVFQVWTNVCNVLLWC